MIAGTSLRRLALGLLTLAVVSGGAEAYVRIRIGGTLLYWQDPAAVSWRWSAVGSEDVSDGSDEAAIARAFENWESSEGSRVGFHRQEDTWSQDTGTDSHLIVFDEDGSSGWFPPGAGVVAITPLRYLTGSGRIIDADIIFNGRDYTFSTDGSAGTFDIQDVATHEIGHLLGLDHSPVLSATMWPWVSQQQHDHRSLAADDHAGVAALAARGNPGRLTGSLRDAGGGALSGARVSAISTFDGELLATALSTETGQFTLRGIPNGDVFLHIAPVSGSFTSNNLAGTPQLDDDFAAGFWGGWDTPQLFTVTAGGNTACGTWTGAPASALREHTSQATQFVPGQTAWVTVPLDGLEPGMTAHTRNPALSVHFLQLSAGMASARIIASGAATPGIWDLYLRAPSGELVVASGAIEVVAPPPAISGLSSGTGDPLGGDTLTVHGADFQEGSWVLFGGAEAPAVTWIDANTLEVQTPPGVVGQVDVIVINADGQEARLVDGFRYTVTPRLDSLLPTAGQSIGLTRLYLHGSGFGPQTEVYLDGVPLATTQVAPNVLQVVTQPHPPGSVELVLRNPQAPDEVHPGAFRFVATPDPVVTRFTPDRGPKGGGTRVGLKGAGLDRTVQVRFGVDPVSGAGGAPGAALAVHSGGSVAATTVGQPGTGEFGVLLMAENGQGVLVSGFTFEDNPQRAGSGCGGVIDGVSPADPMSGLLELLLPFLAWWLTRMRGGARLRASRCSSASF